jgi:DNA-binding HxlR family transcriptional regulator
MTPKPQPDLQLTRDALASSTLAHGLGALGDRWTVGVLLGAFIGMHKFEDWHLRLGIPRSTLSARLKSLCAMGLLRQRPYQQRPVRMGYHLTRAGLQLYPQVLMVWEWERRWGTREVALPTALTHTRCGHNFTPTLACAHCGEATGMANLDFTLVPNAVLLAQSQAASPARATRLQNKETQAMGLGLRVDRWTLLIIAAVVLGCHYYDQLSAVLGIASSVLARRLQGLVQSDLLLAEPDVADARRTFYRLTPASHDLFGYIVCVSHWASAHLGQASSIVPRHKACGHAFAPQVVCSHCHEVLTPHAVSFTSDLS